jgi:hypothetical protein
MPKARWSVVRGGANYWVLRRKLYSNYYKAWSEYAEQSFPTKALAQSAGRAWAESKRENPRGGSSGVRAQVRRLPSGQVQIRIPLKRNEDPLRKARQIAKALGRRITSIAKKRS